MSLQIQGKYFRVDIKISVNSFFIGSTVKIIFKHNLNWEKIKT